MKIRSLHVFGRFLLFLAVAPSHRLKQTLNHAPTRSDGTSWEPSTPHVTYQPTGERSRRREHEIRARSHQPYLSFSGVSGRIGGSRRVSTMSSKSTLAVLVIYRRSTNRSE